MSVEHVTTVYRGRIVTVNVETVVLPNAHRLELEVIHVADGSAAVALDDERRVCLLRQFRHAGGGWVWELPAGKVEPSEEPLRTAQRELVEEAGVSAAHWRSLGDALSSPGVFKETIHLFLATGLARAQAALEASEVLEVHWVPLEEAHRRAVDGDIRDAKTVIGLMRAAAVLHP
jgi:8-oxo-dGTP pyrophosphatase MutT (NUDIX family)